ncbi:interferon regulatory factor 2-binding protein 1-like [Oscarella lobularis]|uniref:interferon regulatory factor 2-binding protein 1-like n=1 Tax=Oscarella lobularis TaxID=121494 RepID=UPI003313DA58
MASRYGVPARRKCYLCDLPHSPWAVLTDFSELVCRGCCNYEGADRVEEVIHAARKMRRAHVNDVAVRTTEVVAAAAASNDEERRMRHGSSTSNGNGGGGGGAPLDYTTNNDHHPIPHNVTSLAYKSRYDEIKSAGGLPSPSAAAAVHRLPPTTNQHYPSLPPPPPLPPSSTTTTTTTTAQAIARDTLVGLNKCVPFNVRLVKDPSLVGRVFSFDAIVRGNGESELKIYIEYPPGSSNVFQSVSATGKHMYADYREKMGFNGRYSTSSSGYKDLEYERVHGDWRLLSDFLPEAARYFRAPISSELMPAANLDPKFPYLPSPFVRIDRRRRARGGGGGGDIHENGGDSAPKRYDGRSSGSGDSVHETSLSGRVNGGDAGHVSPGSAVDSVRSSSHVHPSPAHSPNGGGGVNGTLSPPFGSMPNLMAYGRGMMAAAAYSSTVGKSFPVASSLFCLTCRCPLQDTRFVQCPSMTPHKFCFSCSRESIRTAKREGTDVFCPSGQRCPVAGNSTPWAFMQAEIETIMAATGGGDLFKKEK